MSFDSLGLHAALARAVADAGYTTATPVQLRAIPPALAGHDLRVTSSTGSGKTASFVLPALQGVLAARAEGAARDKAGAQGPRVLVLTPTRELAIQVAKACATYGRHVPGLRVATVVGGVPYGAQLKAMRGAVDLLIATPGRLIDHVKSGKLVLDAVQTLVLDEADRMLDMGFIDDIRFIAHCTPQTRQTLMYSATFGGHVGRLAAELLRPAAETISLATHTSTHDHIEQRLHWADDGRHKQALLDHLLATREVDQALVFTSTQRDADWLADRLAGQGHAVASLHGGLPQGRRNHVLQGLRSRQLRVLVATDVAARGIDVPSISHVINYGLPMKAEDYVHRIGRTGRAGRQGLAVTLAEANDAGMIRRIQQFTTQPIAVATVLGLEPKRAAPRTTGARAEGAGPGAGAPSRPFQRKPRFATAGAADGAKREGGPFKARDAGPFKPRGGDGFKPRTGGASKPGGGKRAGPFTR